jgi:hypothetical protein
VEIWKLAPTASTAATAAAAATGEGGHEVSAGVARRAGTEKLGDKLILFVQLLFFYFVTNLPFCKYLGRCQHFCESFRNVCS